MDPKLAVYGTAASRSQLGRFQIAAGGTACVPIWAAGPMYTAAAAQLLGSSGSAYRYGTTKVGGTTNMLSNGNYLYPILNTSIQIPEAGNFGGASPRDIQILLGGTGAGNYDCITNARHMVVALPSVANKSSAIGRAAVFANGEWATQDTTTVAINYGPNWESFTPAGTITVTNGSAAIVGAGTNFDVATLSGGYGYTPSLQHPRQGDVLAVITAGGAYYFYRIVTITDATHLTIFPVAVAASAGAGLSYKIFRTGYGSWSRFEILATGVGGGTQIGSSETIGYYAGNTTSNNSPYTGAGIGGSGVGTIEAIGVSNGGSNSHAMCPLTSPAATQVAAVDIAMYKSYLVYGAGQSISWSVAGFPTAGPFGATDFPSGNIAVIDTEDYFCCFEFVGDQLYAFFQTSTWLVVPTGTVPEFSFYRLPGNHGALLRGISDPQMAGAADLAIAYTRPACRLDAAAAVVTSKGLEIVQGGLPASISPPVDSWDFPEGLGDFELSWDDTTNSIIWTDPGGGRALLYRVDLGQWCILDESALAGVAKGFTGSLLTTSLPLKRFRDCSIGFWNQKRIYVAATQIENETTATSSVPWTWASPLIDLSAEYPKFSFGGFIPMARGPSGLATANMTWTLYGGSSPYNMRVMNTGTFNYAAGASALTQRQGQTIDEAFVGVVLTGSNWIELAGIMVFDAGSQAGR